MNDETKTPYQTARRTCDIFLVGVGGQGVLTIGDIIAEAALQKEVPISYYPTKGMAQRGGFVKAQVRLGRDAAGPQIPEKGADLVIAMERSEALKAVRFIKPDKDFVLYGHVWPPTAVMLGKAPYPSLDEAEAQVREAGAIMHYVDPERRPLFEGTPVPANIFVLGAVLGRTALGQLLDPEDVANLVRNRWKRGAERNALAFQAGMESNNGRR
jgi:indolepyruvate ferredoxin oxidoreductase beta subunit